MFFRGNAVIVSLNVMIFNLCGRELTGLPTFIPLLYNSNVGVKEGLKKKKTSKLFFSRFFCK